MSSGGPERPPSPPPTPAPAQIFMTPIVFSNGDEKPPSPPPTPAPARVLTIVSGPGPERQDSPPQTQSPASSVPYAKMCYARATAGTWRGIALAQRTPAKTPPPTNKAVPSVPDVDMSYPEETAEEWRRAIRVILDDFARAHTREYGSQPSVFRVEIEGLKFYIEA
ncbi:hypothetical protein B0H66DRAFT_532479 [Apodospora peruviana]|uniref:Uncharacterized protein n=1 Tax=Apodospora peruviana TaxID=516989 RepID=A0AAE0M3G3_9PEZI|nr:hypothetical protein B0H66DRAFT_532479 [Apodospora peruviana]